MDQTNIREITLPDRKQAMKLVMDVFQEFEAPEYAPEGIKTFREYIENEEVINALDMYGAWADNKMVGVIASKNEGSHISLFFVDGKYHQRGIGRKLFRVLAENSSSSVITVNSSPYAVEIYRHLGFSETSEEQLRDGIRYTPMVYRKPID